LSKGCLKGECPRWFVTRVQTGWVEFVWAQMVWF
jgi:hypothetical protein